MSVTRALPYIHLPLHWTLTTTKLVHTYLVRSAGRILWRTMQWTILVLRGCWLQRVTITFSILYPMSSVSNYWPGKRAFTWVGSISLLILLNCMPGLLGPALQDLQIFAKTFLLLPCTTFTITPARLSLKLTHKHTHSLLTALTITGSVARSKHKLMIKWPAFLHSPAKHLLC